ncbi:hypothetical protein DFQ28_001082 [Apophysomyces sp. BC1034]|nr:hypothetical protein DFQ28_001082 [Apophysomyces sp. BC1034]
MDNTPLTWASFCQAFCLEFKPSNSEQLACSHLKQLKQTRTIAEYIVAFRNSMLELPNMDGEDAKDQFIQGLCYEARLQVLFCGPANLTQAYIFTENYEAAQQSAQGMQRDRQTNAYPAMEHANNDGVVPMDLDAIY